MHNRGLLAGFLFLAAVSDNATVSIREEMNFYSSRSETNITDNCSAGRRVQSLHPGSVITLTKRKIVRSGWCSCIHLSVRTHLRSKSCF
jgi:hypothetical protein